MKPLRMRALSRGLWLLLGSCAWLGVSASDCGAVSVFPGARGAGTMTPAGRGGVLHRVTTLAAAGPGSLRACIEASGPRVCAFEVGGTIRSDENFAIRNPYLTIAGHTAPSPGITIAGAGLVISTHDVLVQHLRIRTGDDPRGPGGPQPCCRDALSIQSVRSQGLPDVHGVVIDHVSVSWAVDENLEIWGAKVRDVTVSHSIISEALSHSIHPKGPHSMGALVGDEAQRISLISNLMAHNGARNPKVTGGTTSLFANNVVYSWGTLGASWSGQGSKQPLEAAIVGNVFVEGPTTRFEAYRAPVIASGALLEGSRLYLADNLWITRSGARRSDVVEAKTRIDFRATEAPELLASLDLLPASAVEAAVLRSAGARPRDRDPVDLRIVDDVARRSCLLARAARCIVDSPHDVGGWPAPRPTQRPLSPPPDPSGDDDGDGYTNLEEWLHGFYPQVEP